MQTSTSLLHCLPVPGPDTARLYAILPEAPQPIFLKLNIASSHQCNGDDFSAPYSLTVLSHVRLFATPWTVAHQAPLSMGFFRQQYWGGLAISFSKGSSQTRDQTQISCIASSEPPGNCGIQTHFHLLWALIISLKTSDLESVHKADTKDPDELGCWQGFLVVGVSHPAVASVSELP